MDSDKKGLEHPLKPRVDRIVKELEPHGFAWVTEGKEVENYIPIKGFEDYRTIPISGVPPYMKMYLFLYTITLSVIIEKIKFY